jgi:death-on-curing protein
MHNLLIQETGGSDGIRDEGLLDSALNAPFSNI